MGYVASNNGQFIFRQFQRTLIDSDDEGYFTSNSDSFVQKNWNRHVVLYDFVVKF